LVLDLLTELKQRGTALIWIGHDLRLVAAVADRVMVLDAGRVVEQGPPETLTTEPRHALTRQLVAAAQIGHPSSPPVPSIDTRSEPRR
jgi:peptide/nickel transport system ATP-binding protein